MSIAETTNRTLTISRLLDAPRELVWEVFTNPQHIKHWWGPNGFTNTIHKMDVKVNGHWSFIMHGPDGTDYKNENVFAEVVQLEKIVYDHVSIPIHRTTILFEQQGSKTLLHFTLVFETAEVKEQAVKTFKADEGLKQNIARLELYLSKRKPIKEMTITRIYKAPRALVFKAWTDAEQLAKWWGPTHFTNPVCEIDVQIGGRIYIEMKAPDGTIYPMDGVFTVITEPSLLAFSSGALDTDGNRLFDVMNTVLFEEEGEHTKLTIHASVSNAAPDTDKYLNGMQEGWSQSLTKLENLLINN